MTTSTNPLRIGVIGCGHWGPNHVRVFSQLKDCQVVAIADASDKRLAVVGESFPHLRRFTDYRTLLAESDANAVIVVTPTNTHHAIVTEALRAGKHVLCEKPLCVETAHGE